MKIPSFKLKFQTSQLTNIATPIITDRIYTILSYKKYKISEATDNSVIFKHDPFKLVWNFEAPYLLDGGDFEITESESGTIVVLNYFINILYTLLLIAIFVTIIIIQGEYLELLFLGAFFLITGTYQFFTTKQVGKELLRDALTKPY